ncbi:putative fungistatic metabolite [Parachaetomium inaequale]|uniref:Fungistatic metabolite n=1 Tax=Parachaetomium inaequale TaxID=2588326 RepID=A0AAN6SN11_9PEZI|nr:putative fungistatic metabolite [Parachaetomium inaequale]
MHLPSISILLPLAAAATAQSTSPLTIVTAPSSGYTYHGCYNETTGLPDTAGMRALGGGTNLVRAGNMTVEMCWEFCRSGAGDASGGKTGKFLFAGVEYARECWCAQALSSLSEKVPDSECNLPCEGNTTQACGGNLKLTVYMAGAAAARVSWAIGLVAVGAMSLALI